MCEKMNAPLLIKRLLCDMTTLLSEHARPNETQFRPWTRAGASPACSQRASQQQQSSVGGAQLSYLATQPE